MPAELRVGTEVELKGPWLIDKDQLERLDNVLDDIFKRLTARNKARASRYVDRVYEKEVNRRARWSDESVSEDTKKAIRKHAEELGKQYPFNVSKREVVIGIENNKKLVGACIADILKQPNAHEAIASSIHVKIEVGDVSCELSTSRSVLLNTLDISVRPETDNYSYDSFSALRAWAMAVQAPRWQQIWRHWRGFHWFFVFLVSIVVLMQMAPRFVPSPYIEQAHTLLKNGIDQENSAKAMEIILALQSGYVPPNTVTTIPSPWENGGMLLLGVIVLIGIILQIAPPGVLLGFGGGQAKLQTWRSWIKFVFVSVPAFLLVDFVALAALDRISQFVMSSP